MDCWETVRNGAERFIRGQDSQGAEQLIRGQDFQGAEQLAHFTKRSGAIFAIRDQPSYNISTGCCILLGVYDF